MRRPPGDQGPAGRDPPAETPANYLSRFLTAGTHEATSVKNPTSLATPMAKGVYVGRSRHPGIVIVLGIITAFVHTAYWYYAANTEMHRRGLKRANAVLWTILVCIPLLQVIAVQRTVANLRAVYLANSIHRDPSPWSLALLSLLFPYAGAIIAAAIVQSGLNKVWYETREKVITDGPESKDLRCPSCEAVFEIRKNPYTEAIVTCPSCDYEGVV